MEEGEEGEQEEVWGIGRGREGEEGWGEEKEREWEKDADEKWRKKNGVGAGGGRGDW